MSEKVVNGFMDIDGHSIIISPPGPANGYSGFSAWEFDKLLREFVVWEGAGTDHKTPEECLEAVKVNIKNPLGIGPPSYRCRTCSAAKEQQSA